MAMKISGGFTVFKIWICALQEIETIPALKNPFKNKILSHTVREIRLITRIDASVQLHGCPGIYPDNISKRVKIYLHIIPEVEM